MLFPGVGSEPRLASGYLVYSFHQAHTQAWNLRVSVHFLLASSMRVPVSMACSPLCTLEVGPSNPLQGPAIKQLGFASLSLEKIPFWNTVLNAGGYCEVDTNVMFVTQSIHHLLICSHV